MKANVFHYYPARIEEVYSAYKHAVRNAFETVADATQPHALSFKLDFSFKYNMNGGDCKLYFAPYRNGTVVRVHYVVVQLLGARYKAHAIHLSNEVVRLLGVQAEDIQMDIKEFERIYDQQTAFPKASVAAPETPAAPTKAKFCPQCGTAFPEFASFCVNCGAKRE